ncbi:hypothetical protein LIER_39276 [Lithospermum erythrorhizon]|uniref:Integrase catalytic domain-containing protein n=1 Tax=Lithospermum erythrorhizon TaxID=34254 RepID=A0AAV3QEX4_LITER
MDDNEGRIDPSSPYYLGSGDQHGNLITNVILAKDNYSLWRRNIVIALKARRKFGFVDGTINQPTENRKLLNWETEKPEPLHAFAFPLSCYERSKLSCTHYRQTGHYTSTCFKLHGYPPWWEERRQGKSRPQGAPAGRGRGASSPMLAAAMTVGPPAECSGADSIAALKPDQVRVLMNMIRNQQTESMTGESSSNCWILDTGASHHVTGNRSSLLAAREIRSCPIDLPDGHSAMATLEGRVRLPGGLMLLHVFYVPKFTCNLISVAQLIDDTSCYVQFTNELCLIRDRHSGNPNGAGERSGGLYYYRRIPAAKQCRDSFPISDSRASTAFDLLHCDLWGPNKLPASNGACYFLTIVDDYSRAVWVYLLHAKSDVFTIFRSFMAMITRQFQASVKVVRSDNGTEFKPLLSYFTTHGILFQTSCVGTPQQNGRVERKHRLIVNVANALMFQADLPVRFWGECVLGAVHFINRTPCSLLEGRTPIAVLTGKEPNFAHLRVFGCLCFAHDQRSRANKFAPRSRKCVFVGYPNCQKGWKLYDLSSGEFFVSRDVQFHEGEFPFAPAHSTTGTSSLGLADVPAVYDSDDEWGSVPAEPIAPNIASSTSPDGTGSMPPVEAASRSSAGTDLVPAIGRIEGGSATASPGVEEGDVSSREFGRGLRSKYPSVRLRDFVTHTTVSPSPLSSTTMAPRGTLYPLSHYVNCPNFSLRHRVFLSSVITGVEPRNFTEALSDPGWCEVMAVEIAALEANGTWDMTPLPPHKKALGCK